MRDLAKRSTRSPDQAQRPQQLPFAFEAPARVRRGQVVAACPEDPALYEAVRTLRRSGHRVYRAGEAHKVDDKLLSTPQVFRLARSYRRAVSR